MTIINNTGQSLVLGDITIARYSTGVVDDAVWYAEYATSDSLRDNVQKGYITAYDDGSEPAYPPIAPGTEFIKEFTSSDDSWFSWIDNVLTVNHSLNSNVVKVEIFDGDGNPIDYTWTNIGQNSIEVNFPVAVTPISGTYKIRIL